MCLTKRCSWRARIAEALIASLDETPGPEVERAWQEEIARRVQEVDTGKVKCIPWEEVRALLYENAKAKRRRTSRGLRGGRRVTLNGMTGVQRISQDTDYLENPPKQAQVRDYEKQIDQMVYKLYSLTPEEIAVVEDRAKQ